MFNIFVVLGAVLGLCVSSVALAQEMSTQEAVQASGTTDQEILDLAQEIDKVIEQQKAQQGQLLQQLEATSNSEEMQRLMNTRTDGNGTRSFRAGFPLPKEPCQ